MGLPRIDSLFMDLGMQLAWVLFWIGCLCLDGSGRIYIMLRIERIWSCKSPHLGRTNNCNVNTFPDLLFAGQTYSYFAAALSMLGRKKNNNDIFFGFFGFGPYSQLTVSNKTMGPPAPPLYVSSLLVHFSSLYQSSFIAINFHR